MPFPLALHVILYLSGVWSISQILIQNFKSHIARMPVLAWRHIVCFAFQIQIYIFSGGERLQTANDIVHLRNTVENANHTQALEVLSIKHLNYQKLEMSEVIWFRPQDIDILYSSTSNWPI